MSHPVQNQENAQASDTPKKNGKFLVVFGLMFGVAVLSLLLFLRNQKLNLLAPTGGPASLQRGLEIRKATHPEIQAWIVAELAKRNAKIGIVNIWATWCAPCRDEMPELVKFQKSGAAPLFLISADNELDEPLARAFLSEMGVDFPSVLAKGDQQAFVEEWQKLSSSDPTKQWSMTLPATFVVGSRGEILSFMVGTNSALSLQNLVKKTLDTMRD